MRFGIDSHSAEREGEGNSTYCRSLISALATVGGGHDFPLFAGNPDHAFYRTVPPGARFPVIRVAQGKGLARLGWSLARAAARERVDGLHVQYTAPIAYRGPLVVTVHDLAFLHVPESFPLALRVALRVLVPWSMGRASRIITDSEFGRRDIVDRYAIRAEKIAVISLAADPRFRPRTSQEVLSTLGRYGLRPGFFFSLGRLNRRKNLERLLDAYAEVVANGLSETPLVIGGKLDYGFRELFRRSGERSGVHFTGLIADEDLPAFFNGAACFVYPSLFEGFGLPVLEAMACGTPVVASNRAALPELVGDAALLVDPKNIKALSQAMVRVLTDGDLAADLRHRGLARSRQFSWRETAEHTLAIYTEALRQR